MGPLESTVLVVLAIYVLCLVVSAQNGQWIWFVLGLFVAPLALIGALLPAKPESHNGRKRMRQCTACAEYVKKEARVCRYCGTVLEPARPFRMPAHEEPNAIERAGAQPTHSQEEPKIL